jgi:hypothetical protein
MNRWLAAQRDIYENNNNNFFRGRNTGTGNKMSFVIQRDIYQNHL